ncbi:glycosyltransferase [Pasteurellaceae bacterium RH1A]|nr:glycosyltransferase [Pasteurellaceae bacterium RH1A]
MKPTLSLVMIVKNEEQDLAQCLDTVKDWVDEIIIVDSGSSDQTLEIAKKYQAKVYQHNDWQGFGKQRQTAQGYATSDYILWLDADERVSPELQQSIKQALLENKTNTLYQINRLSSFLGRKIYHSGWYPEYIVRLYPRQLAQYNDALVHEKVIYDPSLKVINLSGDLLHYPYKSLKHYLTKSASYAEAWAEQRIKQNKKTSVFQALSHAFSAFIKMYLFKKGFLDGKQGFLLAILSANSVFNKYATLWSKQVASQLGE